MRVLQVVLSLNPGGTERLVADLATRLNDEIPTAVCCLDERGEWGDQLDGRGIPVTALGRRPGFQPGLALGVARAARAHGATVLHAHQYSPFVYSALARLRQPGLRVVFTEHGRLSDAGPSSKRRQANRLLRHLASRVFTVSEDVRQHLVAEGFQPDQVGVIYNGIDVGRPPDAAEREQVRRELGVGDDAVVAGTVARLDPVKDLVTLLEAAALSDANLQLVVVGDGPERTALEARAADLDIGARVRFLGHRKDARRWLAGCDLYVNSSISEGVSLTILEAMAAGLPVIATRVGGTSEVIDDTCGLLTPPRDAPALAETIRLLATDGSRRGELGREARRRVEARFTLDRMVREYADVYRNQT